MPQRESVDLNAIVPRTRKKVTFDWSNRRRSTKVERTTAHFGDIAPQLERFLRESEEVVACVAWITSDRILAALAGKRVSIIVNKEADLRTDERKRARFARLRGGFMAGEFPAPMREVTALDTKLEAVRCTGHCPRVRSRNSPLMHHKFAVRLRDGKPVAVWTGSFNWSSNASTSIENAVEIHDPAVAAAYFAEFARVLALSEPLDFTVGKSDPSWVPRTAQTAPAKKTAAKAASTRKPTAKKPTTSTRKAATTPSKPPARTRTRSAR